MYWCSKTSNQNGNWNYSSSSSYSNFYVGSTYDDIHLHVACLHTSSADSPFSLILFWIRVELGTWNDAMLWGREGEDG